MMIFMKVFLVMARSEGDGKYDVSFFSSLFY